MKTATTMALLGARAENPPNTRPSNQTMNARLSNSRWMPQRLTTTIGILILLCLTLQVRYYGANLTTTARTNVQATKNIPGVNSSSNAAEANRSERPESMATSTAPSQQGMSFDQGMSLDDHQSSVCNVTTVGGLISTDYSDVAITALSNFSFRDNIPRNSWRINKENATCELDDEYKYTHHFPHFMQQFCRCWSFWNAHPHLKRQFLTIKGKEFWDRARKKGPFTGELMQLLPKMGIDVIQDVNPRNGQNLKLPFRVDFQVASLDDMPKLREEILTVLSLRKQVGDSCSGQQPRIALVNRERTRRILNSQEVIQDLQSHFGLNYAIPEIFLEGADLKRQVKIFANIDILITPHGAQETNIVWMPRCGQVLEMMPEDYWHPVFFGTLAATAGSGHSVLFVAQNVSHQFLSQNQMERTRARRQNFCLSRPMVRKGVEQLMEAWNACCKNDS